MSHHAEMLLLHWRDAHSLPLRAFYAAPFPWPMPANSNPYDLSRAAFALTQRLLRPIFRSLWNQAGSSCFMRGKLSWRILKDSVVQWMEDQPFQLASSLSYYTMFSLAPLLILVIAVAGFAFGQEAAQNRIVETIQGSLGARARQQSSK